MSASVIIEEQVHIPLDLRTVAEFRHWAHSDSFPERGRVDYIHGDIEVDMSPEDLFSHGTIKGEIYAALLVHAKQQQLGHLFTDSTRLTNVAARLSVEPDILLVTYAGIDAGRIRLVPKKSGESGRYVEVEGEADLVVEIVSDRSVTKETQRLPKAYFDAGVREFWLADARGDHLVFQVFHRGGQAFQQATADSHGYQTSKVLGESYRLQRSCNTRGHWEYELQAAAQAGSS